MPESPKRSTAAALRETLQRKGLHLPRMLTLALTGACNLRCGHCWVEAGPDLPHPPVPEADLCRLLREFSGLGGEGVRLTGGEPLCHPGWLRLLRLARRLGFDRIELQTNAILFDDGEVAALRPLDFPGLAIQVSLDGATAAAHDRVRGADAFQGAMAGLERLVRGGLASRITIFFTEMRHNLEEIPDLLELARKMGIGSVVTGTLVRCGRAAEESALTPPEPDQYLRLLQRFEKDPRFRELYAGIGKVAAIEWLAAQASRSEACTFVENPYLTPDGRLYPCVLCQAEDFAVSGVHHKGLAAALAEGATLWSSLLRISRSRAAAIGACRACPDQSACAGGCMGRAWGSCGDLRAADDRCDVRQAVYRRARSRRC